MLSRVIKQVREASKELGDDILFYRGHAEASWPLLPGLARYKTGKALEPILYYDFITRAGTLLPPNCSSWNSVFAMQHHGLPTRLLDWTTTFGVALYFALRQGRSKAAVWVLNPFELNKCCWGSETLPSPDDLESDYFSAFIAEEKKFECRGVAVSPTMEHPRVLNQRSSFTLHGDLDTPLEKIFPGALRKINIPASEHDDALEFLRLAGISEYSLYPDLDGLARELLMEHFG